MLLIDGSNLLHRACHVPEMWDLKAANGQRTGGVHGFLNGLSFMVSSIREASGGLVICWDKGVSEYRKAIFPEYKQDRVSQRMGETIKFRGPGGKVKEVGWDEFLEVYEWSRSFLHGEILPGVGLLSLQVANVEADDIIAWVCHSVETPMRKIIASTDKDMYQLLNDKVYVYHPIKRKYIKRDTVIADWNLMPDNYLRHFLLTKAMMGDKSDGIPGIPGIKEKTGAPIAQIVLTEGSAALDSKKTRHRSFLENKEMVKRNIKLIDLRKLDEKSKGKIKQAVLSRAVLSASSETSIESVYERLESFQLRQARASLFSILHRSEEHSAASLLIQTVKKETTYVTQDKTQGSTQTPSRKGKLKLRRPAAS